MTPMLRSIASCALLVLSASPTAAQPVDAAPRIELDLSGVDLSTTQGLDTARHQISGAARAVCANLPDTDGWHLQTSACVKAARDQANSQLTALHEKVLAQRALRSKAAVQTASLVP